MECTPHPRLAKDIRLGEEISSLYAHINAATFTFLEKLRKFDQRSAFGIFECKSTAHWLNWQCGTHSPYSDSLSLRLPYSVKLATER